VREGRKAEGFDEEGVLVWGHSEERHGEDEGVQTERDGGPHPGTPGSAHTTTKDRVKHPQTRLHCRRSCFGTNSVVHSGVFDSNLPQRAK
jgi:hypothetical protein